MSFKLSMSHFTIRYSYSSPVNSFSLISISMVLVPLGFIYVQLPLHPSPQTLWPNLHWRNVSSSYAGLFFRAEGGTASAFGVIQSESSNRLGNLESSSSSIGDSTSITVPSKGWSEFVRTGYGLYPYVKYQGIRVQNTGNETFPRNMAMRIWERI